MNRKDLERGRKSKDPRKYEAKFKPLLKLENKIILTYFPLENI